jgi:uncharacterized cofD-like protein
MLARVKRILKWLYPGMRIKRWILLTGAGLFVVGIGSARLLFDEFLIIKAIDVLAILIGIALVIAGIKKMMKSFIAVFLPQADQDLVDIIFRKRQLEKGTKIVAIGGGTGLGVLLSGMKSFTSNLTAIVTMADDGGSSGRLRAQFNVLPPGDIRNCLVALADAEPLMQNLFQFRFGEETELQGHSFGNLFITAMTKLTGGDFEKAIEESSKVLAIRGKVVPATLDRVTLNATYSDGTKAIGEASIPQGKGRIAQVFLSPEEVKASKGAIKAIDEAELIILGPGSLYTSIIPNLLIRQIYEAIVKSRAFKVYICNVMTQKGETDGYSAFDHLQALITHTDKRIVDCCVVNSANIPEKFLAQYREQNSYPVVADCERIRNAGFLVVRGDLLNFTDFVRHDNKKLAKVILNIITNYV